MGRRAAIQMLSKVCLTCGSTAHRSTILDRVGLHSWAESCQRASERSPRAKRCVVRSLKYSKKVVCSSGLQVWASSRLPAQHSAPRLALGLPPRARVLRHWTLHFRAAVGSHACLCAMCHGANRLPTLFPFTLVPYPSPDIATRNSQFAIRNLCDPPT